MNFMSSLNAKISRCLRIYLPHTLRAQLLRKAQTIKISLISLALSECLSNNATILSLSPSFQVGSLISFANTPISYICIKVSGFTLKRNLPTLIFTDASASVFATFSLSDVFISKMFDNKKNGAAWESSLTSPPFEV